MNFKEALIAHLQGEKVEADQGDGWVPLIEIFGFVAISNIDSSDWHPAEFRIAPRTIIVNGVEVPAGEKVVPEDGVDYYFASPHDESYFARSTWTGHELDNTWFERGLIYLNKDDAITRAKAMLLTSDK